MKDAIQQFLRFTFNNNFGNNNISVFGLTDDSTTGLPSFDAEVLPGKYSVSEDEAAGWKLTALFVIMETMMILMWLQENSNIPSLTKN